MQTITHTHILASHTHTHIHVLAAHIHVLVTHTHTQEDEDAFTSLGTGNRLATVLFYVSFVVQYFNESHRIRPLGFMVNGRQAQELCIVTDRHFFCQDDLFARPIIADLQ